MKKRERKNPVDFSISRRLLAGGLWLGVAALAVTACNDIAPPFSLTGTGGLEGLVFFDASEDGIFDPSDGDFAVSGVGVAVQQRGTGSNIAAVTSAADGRFTFADIPIGTHDLLLDTLTLPAGVVICQNPMQVTVVVGATRFSNVEGRAGCLITIAAAKDQGSGGAFVVVRGVLTSEPGQVEARRTYIQDQTTGTLIFDGAFATTLAGMGLTIGDQIEVSGFTAEFSTDFELVGAALRETVLGVGAIEPDTVTTKDVAGINGFDNPLQGRLIRIENAELTVAFGDNTGSSSNAFFDDGSGATVVRIDRGVVPSSGDIMTTDLPSGGRLTLGNCYDINGFGASFAGAGQIFPRSLADIVEVACN